MRAELVLGLLGLLVATAVAEKTKPTHQRPPIADGKPDPRQPTPHHRKGGHHGGHHQKTNKGGHHQGGERNHEGAAALKEEIMRIKSSDLPEEEKAARLQALRAHVKGSQMVQSMPPEVRARQEEMQARLKEIQEDPTLTQEEKEQQIAEEKAKFKKALAAFRESLTPEQIRRMQEERKKTIEGHTAAAMAAKQAGKTKMAREYQRRAETGARGYMHEGHKRQRRGPNRKKRSLSDPDFF